jgi:hypothetical protein
MSIKKEILNIESGHQQLKKYLYSVILMNGTEIVINAKEMILECGHLLFQRVKMENPQSSMIADLNAVLLKIMEKELIEFLHGLNLLDKTCRAYYMKEYFGTLLKSILGKVKSLNFLRV